MDQLLLWILVGSWCVPVITLAISWWITRKYLLTLSSQAKQAAKAAEAAAIAQGDRILNAVQEFQQIVEGLPEKVASEIEIPDVEQIIRDSLEEEIPNLQETLKSTLDGKIGDFSKKIRKEIRRKNPDSDENSGGFGLLSSLLGFG